MITERQEYIELESVEDAYARLDDWNVWQIKYDGIWGRVVIDEGFCTIYSRTNVEKLRFVLPQIDLFYTGRTELLAEYMYGSQWAQKDERKGKIFVFDCTMIGGADLREFPYKERYRQAMAVVDRLRWKFEIVKTLGKQHLGGFWLTSKGEYEGVILRKWDDPYNAKLLKLKYEVEDDFVIMGMVEGNRKYQGSMGALILGQYNTDEELVEVMRVGGGFDDSQRQGFWDNRGDYTGCVCLIQGKARFESGALRHPTYIKVRDDKLPTECRLKSTSQ